MVELGMKFNIVPVYKDIDNVYVWYENINAQLTVPSLKYDGSVFTQTNDQIVKFLCEQKADQNDLIPYDEARKDRV